METNQGIPSEEELEKDDVEEPEEEEQEEKPEEDEGSDDDELVVSIGDEKPPEEDDRKAAGWIRELRKSHRETVKKNRELEEKLQSLTSAQPSQAVRKKPTLDDDDINFDAEKYEKALEDWHEQKHQHRQEEEKQKQAQEAVQKEWQSRLDSYGRAKKALKVKDFDDAEAVVQEQLSMIQQGILLQGAENAALLVYALGKNPKKAKELASIADPVKFTAALVRTEMSLKTGTRKAPPPETRVSGTKGAAGSVDSNLERLRAEAERTGDMSKVIQYNRQQKLKQKG